MIELVLLSLLEFNPGTPLWWFDPFTLFLESIKKILQSHISFQIYCNVDLLWLLLLLLSIDKCIENIQNDRNRSLAHVKDFCNVRLMSKHQTDSIYTAAVQRCGTNRRGKRPAIKYWFGRLIDRLNHFATAVCVVYPVNLQYFIFHSKFHMSYYFWLIYIAIYGQKSIISWSNCCYYKFKHINVQSFH